MGKKNKRTQGRTVAARMPLDPESMALKRLVDAHQYAEIEASARRILEQKPRHSLAMKALGVALMGLDRCREALSVIEHAISLYPADPELHNNRGIALSMLMRWDESLEAFAKTLALEGDTPETLKNLGVAYFRMHRWNDAVPLLLKAIECHPGDYVEAISVLADTLQNANRVDEAWTCYNELWRSYPESVSALSRLIAVSLKRCDWQNLPENLALCRKKSGDFTSLGAEPFSPLAWPGVTSPELKLIACSYLRSLIPLSLLEAAPAFDRHAWSSSPEKLRIGYFSADFRNHPVGQVIAEVIERHDRGCFEVFGYSLAAPDESALHRRLSASFDHFIDLSDAGFSETAERIRADGIHVLIDLHGWTTDGRPESLVFRCAPIQVNWLGYAGTAGHRRLADYILGDSVVTPHEQAENYCETIVNLPSTYMPADTTTMPAPCPTRQQAGLPETGFVFCSFNNSYKFNPLVFDLWAKILKSVDESVLWLSKPPGGAGERLREQMGNRGVEPARLIFAPRVDALADHHARIQLADLALDPFPYNSHSSGVDVLWAGVPMVSLLGTTFPGRVGASLLRAAGLHDLVAESQGTYCDLAVMLANDPVQLRRYRDVLSQRKALPLFNTQLFVRNLEKAYSLMWKDFCAGVCRPISVGG